MVWAKYFCRSRRVFMLLRMDGYNFADTILGLQYHIVGNCSQWNYQEVVDAELKSSVDSVHDDLKEHSLFMEHGMT